ncbi:EAL domain-containing protein [Motiliproteus coralliicola]|uniref:EAL domain-containing protein n=1 Tax=Motiliproteus coralliicola TaxID=2283196 RepID=A0A369WEI4_9GAMM|nr:EAL domain-containing protein [Motiliproteus coralliicola]RDE19094.1 EAL domain-containing protein [Motiliproteus coralliicola]
MKIQQLLRYGIILVVVTLFATSAVLSYQRHAETVTQLALAEKTGAWASSELDGELRRFLHALEMAGAGRITREQLMLRFDLLWSRMEVLSIGTEAEEVRNLPGAAELFSSLWQQMRFSEQALLALEPGNWDYAQQVAQPFRRLQTEVRAFNVRSFQGSPNLSAAEPIGFGLSMFGLLISGAILVVLVVRESARNRLQALLDELTQLPNRKYLNQHLAEVEGRAKLGGHRVGLLMLDLNNFKEINDSLGHAAGDEMLIQVSKLLRAAVPKGQMVARMGGDEFAIVLEQGVDQKYCETLATCLSNEIGVQIEVGDNRVLASVSIGVSVYPDDGATLSQVLINADMAMYMAKRDPAQAYRLFELQMNLGLQRRRELAEDLRQAILTNHLDLHYQPLVRLDTGRIESVEALLRWDHPKHGMVSPLEVVAVAEQYDLALELNEWVIATACQQSLVWEAAKLPPVKMAVNISPAMYTKHDLVGSVSRIIDYYGIKPGRLMIEVTEDTTMQDIESSPDILHGLHRLGVELALDDFGTGYSSLSHLKKLPVDRLKIDKSFVHDLNNEPKDLRFIRTILSLAKSLELEVVAEGVELPQNLTDLTQEGCTLGQGYLFSKPVDADALEKILRDQQQGIRLPPWSDGYLNRAI